MLAALAFNENRLAEIRGERTVQRYECYSKAKSEEIVKFPIAEQWKAQIFMEETIECKKKHGPGHPLSAKDLDDGIVDILTDRLYEALQIETDYEISDDDSVKE